MRYTIAVAIFVGAMLGTPALGVMFARWLCFLRQEAVSPADLSTGEFMGVFFGFLIASFGTALWIFEGPKPPEGEG
jgi:hypothetical protein